MNSISFESKTFGKLPCRVRRNRRATRITLRVKPDHLAATIPHGVCTSKVTELIDSNSERIEQVLQEYRRREQAFFLKEPKEIKNGCLIPFQGKMVPLKVHFKDTRCPEYKINAEHIELFCLPLNTPEYQKTLRKKLIDFYVAALKQQLPAIFEKYQNLLNVSVKRVIIKSQRTRWGSCSNLGNININWRLILSPTIALESVVAHELCHLIHPNHSKSFHNLLDLVCPMRVESDAWLKAHGSGILQLFSEF